MKDERLDLTPLDPTLDEVGWRRLAARIRERAAPELARRASRDGVLGTLGHWAWPAAAAAALVALMSASALALVRPREAMGHVVQAFDLDETVSAWLEEGRSPTTDDLALALERDD
jgi:anti-sigma-K factor RskA